MNGVSVGDLDFEVLPVPTYLNVSFVNVTTLPPQCPGTYGIQVDITYTVKATFNNLTVATIVPIIPTEDVTFYSNNRVALNTTSGNVGPVAGYPTSSKYIAPDGTFHDVPVGTCANGPFTNAGADQKIYMAIGNNSYLVRTQSIHTYSAAAGHGTLSNQGDISSSR